MKSVDLDLRFRVGVFFCQGSVLGFGFGLGFSWRWESKGDSCFQALSIRSLPRNPYTPLVFPGRFGN